MLLKHRYSHGGQMLFRFLKIINCSQKEFAKTRIVSVFNGQKTPASPSTVSFGCKTRLIENVNYLHLLKNGIDLLEFDDENSEHIKKAITILKNLGAKIE
jgi:hypothetical protein